MLGCHHVTVLSKVCSNVFDLQLSMHQRPLGLERNKDFTEKVVETEKELYKKAKSGEELRTGMGPLRGSVLDRERSDVSGPIQSIKMYSCAQCTMQERLVRCGNVLCLAIWSRDLAPSTLSTYPSPYLPVVKGTQSSSSLQQGWTWTVGWTFATTPTQIL